MSVIRKNSLSDLSRGSDTWIHTLKLLLKTGIILFLITGLVTFSIWLTLGILKTERYERSAYVSWVIANAYVELGIVNKVIPVQWVDGKVHPIESGVIVREKNIKEVAKNIEDKLHDTFLTALIGGLLAGGLSFGIWWYIGHSIRQNIHLRGGKIVSEKEIISLLKKDSKVGDMTIAGVPIVKNTEVRNFLITGSIGSGKSITIKEMMDQIRKSKQRAIVYDSTGEFIETYYDKHKDVILNPLDDRFNGWNIWAEVKESYDYSALAKSFYPDVKSSDSFWNDGARTVFEYTIQRLAESNQMTNQAIRQKLLFDRIDVLHHFLEGTPAQTYTDPGAEKMVLGIRAALARSIPSMDFLGDDQEPFSITQWVLNEKQSEDGWIFISSKADQHEKIRPLISMWIDIATRTILSLPPSRNRKIWLMLDEIDSLGRLQSLKDLMTRGRKHGSCVVIGLQMISQFREVYGKDQAQTLAGMCMTWLSLQCPDPETAEWLSKSLGMTEIEEASESISYGVSDMKDSMNLNRRRTEKAVVMPTEIMTLKDLSGYLNLPGGYPITLVKQKIRQRKPVAEAYIRSKLLNTRQIMMDIIK